MADVARLQEIAEYLAATGAVAIRRELRRTGTTQPCPRPATRLGGHRAEALVHSAITTALDQLKARKHHEPDLITSADIEWVIEPIGGSHNLARGLPAHTVSVAATLDDITLASAVAEPATGRLWSAGFTQGARLLDSRHGTHRLPVRTGSQSNLNHALVAIGFSADPTQRRNEARLAVRLATKVGDLRLIGSPALTLCWVASGALDGFYQHRPNPTAWRAAVLIAREADAVIGHTATGHLLHAASPAIAAQLTHALTTAGATGLTQPSDLSA
ncbi:inositol monophosphatase family protein [Saccharothrix sp. NPDC042600]|uniref:inositol monophosphatase family protein n=1 Tax=Saccharothrix TaxID=2071 RepID=UPI0033DB756B|nr:hypothetical protein GCM10017745_67720 [Saccharothrix mutabilis subsp. capreolus]